MSATAIEARMSTMLPAGAFAGTLAGWRISMNRSSTSRITTARVPSARVTGAPPAVTTGKPPCLTRASVASTSRTTSTSVALPGILDVERDLLERDALDLHRLDAGADAAYPGRLVALLGPHDVEEREQPRIRVVEGARAARFGHRRHLHPEHVVIERQRFVHVLDERRERPGVHHHRRPGRGASGRSLAGHHRAHQPAQHARHHRPRPTCRITHHLSPPATPGRDPRPRPFNVIRGAPRRSVWFLTRKSYEDSTKAAPMRLDSPQAGHLSCRPLIGPGRVVRGLS